jgi:hypothetical protein
MCAQRIENNENNQLELGELRDTKEMGGLNKKLERRRLIEDMDERKRLREEEEY